MTDPINNPEAPDPMWLAVNAVVEMFSDGMTAFDLTAHMTFTEADTLATLAHRFGNPRTAQLIMLGWAEGDSEADEYTADLDTWGITRAADDRPATGPGEAWEITGEVNR